jgi:hypothetical protein
VADNHAARWSDTAASFVDLNPPGFVSSVARATANRRAAGEAGQGTSFPNGLGHAILWQTDDADSAVDLNPPGYSNSAAHGINSAGAVVGVGANTSPAAFGKEDALLWPDGSPDHVIDLSQFLPESFRGGFASGNGIDEHGNIAGTATGPDFEIHAVVWLPVSSSIPLPAGAMPGLAMIGSVAAAQTLVRRGARRPAQSLYPAPSASPHR